MTLDTINIRHFSGYQDYQAIWQQMQAFTNNRTADTVDEFWILEHQPIFTQGPAAKPEHIIQAGNIPVIATDRGGLVTYHGPGQLIIYLLVDIKRKKMGVKSLVCAIEKAVISLLEQYQLTGHLEDKAPGVYINHEKICSLGLRISRGCSYHGLSLNVDMELEPFTRIHPCGNKELTVTQLSNWYPNENIANISNKLCKILMTKLGYKHENTH